MRAELLRYCSDGLPAFKAPKRIVVSASLPKTERGKLDRRALAERWNRDAERLRLVLPHARAGRISCAATEAFRHCHCGALVDRRSRRWACPDVGPGPSSTGHNRLRHTYDLRRDAMALPAGSMGPRQGIRMSARPIAGPMSVSTSAPRSASATRETGVADDEELERISDFLLRRRQACRRSGV